ncbi:MAG TPA: non-canonical purine NTP pyrophosphatase, partial [Gammaproteobacteria bacterium]|nr:non-canonical purine NTP pyrophosphatase [Gammaproteobacteria bacterium]
MRTLFADLAVELLTQVDLDIPSPAETGLTFVENALIKARGVSAA